MKTVMIVDDESNLVTIFSGVLRKQGYSVVVSEDGETCLKRVREGFSGVILMDVGLPGLDGWKTLRILRDEGLLNQCLVCMLTGQEPQQNHEGLEDLVMDYLLKPFKTERLLEVVDCAFSLLHA